MRIRSISFLTVAALMLTAAACQKGAGGGSGKVEGAAAAALPSLPKETSLVFGFNMGKFRSSKLFAMAQDAVPAEGKATLQQFKENCSIDFMNDIDSVVAAGGGNMDKDRVLVLVKGKWDEAKIGKCAGAMGPKLGKNVTVAKDGAVTTYTAEGEQPVHVAWSGDTAMVTPASMEGDKTYLADLLKQKSTVKDNPAFLEILGKADTTATMYAAILSPETGEVADGLNRMTGGSEKVKAAWFSLNLGKDLNANGGMRLASEAEAKAVAERMNKELEGAKADQNMGQYLKTLTVGATGSEVTFTVALTEQQVDQLLEMAKQMLPMLGMMLGGGGQ
jgi:hypothetical protein